jgi:hypothetical protein
MRTSTDERKGITMSEQKEKQLKKEKRLIKVTRDLICIGVREAPSMCPVYYALKCTLDNCPTQIVSPVYLGGDVSLYRQAKGEGERVFEIKLPQKAKAFIEDLDEGKSVKPFSFEINLPGRLVWPRRLERSTVHANTHPRA